MRAVSQSEVVANFPAIMEEARTHVIVIREKGRDLGAVVSMDDLRIIRQARLAEAQRLGQQAYDTIKAKAEAMGELIEDVEALFQRD